MVSHIQPLSSSVRSKLRSGIAIPSVDQCVEELVLNAVDSGANNIAVRVNLEIHRIQVVDNGHGIPEIDMKIIGTRYATSKCHSLEDLKFNLHKYGYRGEALASIIQISGTVDITSRYKNNTYTYAKLFTYGKEISTKRCSNRPSSGTTITIQDYMYNMPVRRKLIKKVIDVENIKSSMERVILIHPNISISLRNDKNNFKVLQLQKRRSVLEMFLQMFGPDHEKNIAEIYHSLDQFKITGYISTQPHQTKSLQFVYINKRSVLHTKIHSTMNDLLNHSSIIRSRILPNTSITGPGKMPSSPPKGMRFYGIFVLNIECPRNEYDICLEPKKSLIAFRDWDKVLLCLEEMVLKFIKEENLTISLDERFRRTGKDCPREVETPVPHSSQAVLQLFSNTEYKNNKNALNCNKDRAISISDVRAAVHGMPVRREREWTQKDKIENDKKEKINNFESSNSHSRQFQSLKSSNQNIEADNKNITKNNERSSLAALKRVNFDISGPNSDEAKHIESSNGRVQISNKDMLPKTNESLNKITNFQNKEIETQNYNDKSASSLRALKNINCTLNLDSNKHKDAQPLNNEMSVLNENTEGNEDNSSSLTALKELHKPDKGVFLDKNVEIDKIKYTSSIQALKTVHELNIKEVNPVSYITPDNKAIPPISPTTSAENRKFEKRNESFDIYSYNKRDGGNHKPVRSNEHSISHALSKKYKESYKNKKIVSTLRSFEFKKSDQTLHKQPKDINTRKYSPVHCSRLEPASDESFHFEPVINIPKEDETLSSMLEGSDFDLNANENILKDLNIEELLKNTDNHFNSQINETVHPVSLGETSPQRPSSSFHQEKQNVNVISGLNVDGNNSNSSEVRTESGLEKVVDTLLNPLPNDLSSTNTTIQFSLHTTQPFIVSQNPTLEQDVPENFNNETYQENNNSCEKQNVTIEAFPDSNNEHQNVDNSSLCLQRTILPSDTNVSPITQRSDDNLYKFDSQSVQMPNRSLEFVSQNSELSDIYKNINSEGSDKALPSTLSQESVTENIKNFTRMSQIHFKGKILQIGPVDSDSQSQKRNTPDIKSNYFSSSQNESNLSNEASTEMFASDSEQHPNAFKDIVCESKETEMETTPVCNELQNTLNPAENSSKHFFPHTENELSNQASTGVSVSDVDTQANNSQNNSLTNKDLVNTESETNPWKAIPDEHGKTIYINLRTGNTSYSPPPDPPLLWNASQNLGGAPLKIVVTNDFDPLGQCKYGPEDQTFTLSHGFKNFLPSKRKICIDPSNNVKRISLEHSKEKNNKPFSKEGSEMSDLQSEQTSVLRTQTEAETKNSSESCNTSDKQLKRDFYLSSKTNEALNDFLKENLMMEDSFSKWNDADGEHCTTEDGISNIAKIRSLWESTQDFAMDTEVLASHTEEQDRSGATSSIKSYNIVHSYKFTREMLNNCQVYGQVDNKFISVGLRYKHSFPHLVVLVDQHAADERVQLEKVLSQIYERRSDTKKVLRNTRVSPPLEVSFTAEQVRVMKSFREVFREVGLEFTQVNETRVLFHCLPCILVASDPSEKHTRRCQTAAMIVEATVVEMCENVLAIGGTSQLEVLEGVKPLPRSLSHVTNTIACRSAIKFGDELALPECQDLISSLSKCQLPFQCAHGRPSLIPVLDLDFVAHTKRKCRPNLKNLRSSSENISTVTSSEDA